MSRLIRIDRRTIRLNPDYGKSVLLLEGIKRLEVFSPKPLPDKIAKHFYITSANLSQTDIGLENIVYEYTGGGSNIKMLRRFFDKNKTVIPTYIHTPRTIDNSRAPKYYYKYLNPKLKCSECGESVKYNTIERDYTDEGCPYDVCPICHALDSFDYRHEPIEQAITDL